MMLRSAEADPHIIVHTPRAGPKLRRSRVRIALRRRCRSAGGVGGQSSHSGSWLAPVSRRRSHHLGPPEGGPGRLRGRGRGRSVRCAGPHRGGVAAELVETSRSSRLQGFAPLTSPLRHVAVASDVALVSSMGFVVPSKVACKPHHPGDASTGGPVSAWPEPGVGGSGSGPLRQAATASNRWDPCGGSPGCPPPKRRSERRREGAEAGSRRRAFSAGRGNPVVAIGARARPKPWRRDRPVPSEYVRCARW